MPSSPPVRRGDLTVAVMGTGRWGCNLVRVLSGLESVRVAWLVDPDPSALSAAGALAREADRVQDIGDTGYRFNAVAIATPAADHFDHARALLGRRKHVFVEKPAALSASDAAVLETLAEKNGCCFMVGHQLLFHPAFARLGRLVSDGVLGSIRTIEAVRTGEVDLSREPGVIWSYGPHDAAMILALADSRPCEIRATGETDSSGAPTTAEISLRFDSGIDAAIHLAINDGTRVRRLTVRGDRGTAVFDDATPGGSLSLIGHVPERVSGIPGGEPLRLECAHFAGAVLGYHALGNGPSQATEVTRVLEEASRQVTKPLFKSGK